nr:MAG TPA: Protein of unknown function (DUF751) [Caudoviricetes sp.]
MFTVKPWYNVSKYMRFRTHIFIWLRPGVRERRLTKHGSSK